MGAAAITLLTLGGLLQLVGIFAVAWPDLVPWKERASARLEKVYRRVANRILRLFGRRPRGQVIEVSGAASVGVGGHAVAVISVSEEATLERKVAFLVDRDREAQRAEAASSRRIDDLDRDVQKRVDATRAEMRSHFAETLDEAMIRYRPARVAGALLLAAGLICLVAASLV